MAEENGCPIYSQNHLKTRINANFNGRLLLQTKEGISPPLDKICLVQQLHSVTRIQIHPEDIGACMNQQQHAQDARKTNRRIPELMKDVFSRPHGSIMKIHGFITDNKNSVERNMDNCSIMSGVTHVIYENSDYSLKEYLEPQEGQQERNQTVDEKTKLEWCRQLASAVAHLHDVAGVAHRRINHRAVYVFTGTDGKPFLKLGDILFARWPNSNGMTAERNIELAFAAPETLDRQGTWNVNYDLPSDIWSLGMVFFYIMEQRKPFKFLDINKGKEGGDRISKKPNELYQYLSDGHRPQLSPATSDGLKEIIKNCWATDPEQRPTAADVVARLNGL